MDAGNSEDQGQRLGFASFVVFLIECLLEVWLHFTDFILNGFACDTCVHRSIFVVIE